VIEAGRQIRDESTFLSPFRSDGGIYEVPADTSEDAYQAAISETLERKLKQLDPERCQYTVARLEGFTNEEIAENFGVALRIVERKLHRIRRIWKANRDGNSEERQ
jgi:DNA-directed RNA polymerase specialized sigma24 family protein